MDQSQIQEQNQSHTPRPIDLTKEVIREVPGEESPKQGRFTNQGHKGKIKQAMLNNTVFSSRISPILSQSANLAPGSMLKPNIFNKKSAVKPLNKVFPPFKSPAVIKSQYGTPGKQIKSTRHLSRNNFIADTSMNRSSPKVNTGRNKSDML